MIKVAIYYYRKATNIIMKKFFRTKQLVAFLLIVAMLIPTTNIHTVYAAPETSGYNDTVLASLSESRVFLRAGKSKKIKCNVPIGKMMWKSSKKSVATVDKNGRITAVKPGKAIITVTGEYLYGSLSCEVFVSKKISQKQAKKKLLSLNPSIRKECPGPMKTTAITGKRQTSMVMAVLLSPENSVTKSSENMRL